MARQVLPIVGAIVGAFIAPGVGAQWGYLVGPKFGAVGDPANLRMPLCIGTLDDSENCDELA
jgi:hypothetical protein